MTQRSRESALATLVLSAALSALASACGSGEPPAAEGLGTGGGSTRSSAGNGGNGVQDVSGGTSAVGSGAASGAGTGGGSAAGAGTGGGAVISVGGAPASGTGGLDPEMACAAEMHSGQRIPVDIFIMLDISGSMDETTADGATKWDAVNEALRSFLESPESDGLGVGIQYFPLRAADVPAECTSDAQCGAYGPCLLKACANAAPALVACSTSDDCAPGEGPCATLGICPVTQSFCTELGYLCSFDADDVCSELDASLCLDEDCSLAEYQKPDVPIAPLPGNGAALLASLEQQAPEGGTPTGAALQGAVDYVRTYAASNPTHTVAVVLATDGLPTECTPLDMPAIAAIASSAQAGTPSIRTYVIGVFGPEDVEAPGNLNQIATAGGTKTAFIIDTTADVASELTTALDAIRGVTLACEFQIPTPERGDALDYSKVNVQVDLAAGPTDLYYVGDPSACDPVLGGWYYDTDPALGTKPTKISVCPSTCDAFETTTDAHVAIRLGCKTVVAPPR